MARNANLLVNKRSGRVGSYGLVLENLLNSKGQHFHPTNSSIRAHSTTTAKDAGLASPAGVTASGVHNASSVVTGGSTVATVSREAKDAHAHAHAAAVTATAAHLPHSPGHNHGLSATAPSTMHHSRSSTPVN